MTGELPGLNSSRYSRSRDAVGAGPACQGQPPVVVGCHRKRRPVGRPVVRPVGLKRVKSDAAVRPRGHAQVLLVGAQVAGPRVHAVVGAPVHPEVAAAHRSAVVHDVVGPGGRARGACAAPQDVDDHIVLQEVGALVGERHDDALARPRAPSAHAHLRRNGRAHRPLDPVAVDGGHLVVVAAARARGVVQEEWEVPHGRLGYASHVLVGAVQARRAVDLVSRAVLVVVPGEGEPEALIFLALEDLYAHRRLRP